MSVTVSPNNASPASGTPVSYGAYTVNFSTSGSGSLNPGDTITLIAPPGSTFASDIDEYTVNGVQPTGAVASAVNGSTTDNEVVLTVAQTINASSAVQVVASPVGNTNGGASTGNQFFVLTSRDSTTSAPATFTTTAAPVGTAVNAEDVLFGSVLPNSGATAPVTIDFGATTAFAGPGTITVTGPTGTVFPTGSDYTLQVNGGATQAMSGAASGSSVTLTVPAGTTIATGNFVFIKGQGVTLPSTTQAEQGFTATVATSGDSQPVPTEPFTIFGSPTSVSGVLVNPEPTPTNAGATANGGFSFTTTSALSATGGNCTDFFQVTGTPDCLYVNVPHGTGFAGATITVNGDALTNDFFSHPEFFVDSQALSPTTDLLVIATPRDFTGGQTVNVGISGETNPPAAGNYTVQAYSSEDTKPVSSSNTLNITGGGSQIAAASISSPGNTNATAGTAGQASTYSLSFTPTTTLTGSGATVILSAPNGTVFQSGPNYTIDNAVATGTASVGAGDTTAQTVTIQLPTGLTLASGTSYSVVANSVTNPAAGTYGETTASGGPFFVSTSADGNPRALSNDYLIVAATPVITPGSFSVSPTTAGAPAVYTANFTTSGKTDGGVAGNNLTAGTGTITLTGSGTGTAFSATASNYTVNGIQVTAAPLLGVRSVTITTPINIAPSSAVQVVANAVTNPSAGTQSLSVATSTDTGTVAESNTVTITAAATAVTAVSQAFTSGATGNPGASGEQYTVAFKPTTAVPSGGTVTLTFPAGTGVPTAPSSYTINGTPPSSVTANGQSVTLTVANAGGLLAAVSTSVVVNGITEPSVIGHYELSVATSTDTTPVFSQAYVIGSPTTSVSTPTVVNSPTKANTAATYTITFSTSATGPINGATSGLGAPSTITLVFPTAPTIAVADYTIDGIAPASAAAGGPTNSVVLTLPTSLNVPASTSVTVVASSAAITNPAAVGTYNVDVSTTSDTASSVSTPFNVTATSAPFVSSLSPSSGPQAGGTQVTITGGNFTGATAVSFGTAAAQSFTVQNAGTILAVSPTGNAGTVNVTVTVGSGASALTSAVTAADQFTYTAPSYVPESPVRILDTRAGSGEQQGLPSPLVPGTVYTVQVSGLAGVPSNAKAVALNVTAIEPVGNGNLRVFPGGSAPTASNVNYITGQTVANFDVVALSGTGTISLETFGSDTNVALDVEGYFSSTANYTPQTPARILDTRAGSGFQQGITGPIQPGTVEAIQVTGMGGVPTSATSVAVNVTAVEPASNGNLRVFPDVTPGATTAPNASTINYNSPQSSANFDIVQLPSDGKIDVETFGAAVN
ncbi:MAG: beta strand repeat-containing protein, partial [Mycobacteriales bacterium]